MSITDKTSLSGIMYPYVSKIFTQLIKSSAIKNLYIN